MFLLALVGIAPLALASAFGLQALLQQQRSLAEGACLDLARALGIAVDAELRLSTSALETLAAAAPIEPDHDLGAFRELSAGVLQARPEWRQILLLRPDGSTLVAADPGIAGQRALVERESFDDVLRFQRPRIGLLTAGPSGKYGIPVRVPVFRDGALRFVLTAVVQPESVLKVIQRQRVPADWVVSVFDAAGRRVARSRDHEKTIGVRGSETLLALLAAGGDEGVGEANVVEGQRVLTGYVRLRDPHWTVVVGVPASGMDGAVNRSLAIYGGGIAFSLLLAILAAVGVGRRINAPMAQLRLAALSIGRNSAQPLPLPTTDVREIHDVSAALALSAERQAAAEAGREQLLNAERGARQAAETARARWELLARAGATLAGPLDEAAILQVVADAVVPMAADLCQIDLLDEDGELRRTVTRDADALRQSRSTEITGHLRGAPDTPGSIAWVIAHGVIHHARFDNRTALQPGRDADMLALARALNLRSSLVLPLGARGRTFGAVAAARSHGTEDFSEDDTELLSELVRRAALAIDNARLFRASEAAAREAQAASRAKDEFMAMLGHELRNPLAPIVTALHLMDRRGDPRTALERRIIGRQVTHMVRLVDDLMDVSRITKGKVALALENVPLQTVIDSAHELTQPAFSSRPKPIEVTMPSGPVVVRADPLRLAQVFASLLSNAAKFSPLDGRVGIEVSVQREETAGDDAESAGPGHATVQVWDEGMGMTDELLPQVFDLFVQGPQPLHRASGGLGLGLAIVRSLVQLNGGTVSASSEGPGRGSRFTVTLPLAAQIEAVPPAAADEPGAAMPEGDRRRLLVVDDNEDAANTLALLLEDFGYEVRTAPDGPSALLLADVFEPQLALLDIGLPGMDGHELAQRLRAGRLGTDIKLVALTGYGSAADRERALANHFDDHITKPVDAQALVDRINVLLSSAPPAAG